MGSRRIRNTDWPNWSPKKHYPQSTVSMQVGKHWELIESQTVVQSSIFRIIFFWSIHGSSSGLRHETMSIVKYLGAAYLQNIPAALKPLVSERVFFLHSPLGRSLCALLGDTWKQEILRPKRPQC